MFEANNLLNTHY